MKTKKLLQQDEFGRWNGIALVNKPQGKTSHDVVDEIRKKYHTRKVGHAGTLDPFAEGLLILFVGKATKLSDQFLGLDKEYVADVVFGLETDSGDPEGEITRIANEELRITRNQIEKVLKRFQPVYQQYVPVYSSVKVSGDKLRKLARRYDHFQIIENMKEDNEQGKVIQFFNDQDELQKEVPLPSKLVKLYEIEIETIKMISGTEIADLLQEYQKDRSSKKIDGMKSMSFVKAKIRVACSSGTYIRQLAMDMGSELGTGAMLISLQRTKIGDYLLKDSNQ